jgi:hypothetical protein
MRCWKPASLAERLGRSARRSENGSYLPDPLASRAFAFEGAVAADVSEAELAVARFDQRARGLVDTEALARLLLRAESVASSRIVRTVQNWIGTSSFNPCDAVYVPPPPERLGRLLEDLCSFCNTDDLPPIAQAAIAHAQFENIHPFVDGNGRIGRALIHLILRRRGLAIRTLPPISLILATSANDYLDGLRATVYDGPSDSPQAKAGLNLWTGRFAAATRRSIADTSEFEQRISAIEADWRTRLGSVRANSATDILLKRLVGAPVLTAQTASKLIGRSFEAANNAVAALVDAKILAPMSNIQRNRVFEVPELITIFSDFERTLASPAGDTRIAAPARPVPRKRARKATCRSSSF